MSTSYQFLMTEFTAARTHPAALEVLRRFVPPVAAFVAGAGPIILLGFSRGGFPVEVVAGYGVALWWLLLVGFLTMAIPRPKPTRTGWIVLAGLVGLTAWGAISLTTSVDVERGLTEVVRLVVAGGSVLLGMSVVRGGQSRLLASGVLGGFTTIVTAAVVSRLFPNLIADASVTAEFLSSSRTRVAWPLNYWNAIAATSAVAVPLAVVLAARSRTAWGSAAALLPVPVLAVGMAFTLSRGGIVVAALACAAALVTVAPRLLVVRTALVAGAVSTVVVIASQRPEALTAVLGGVAQESAGQRVFIVLVVGTVAVGLLQAGLRTADRAHWTPTIPRPAHRLTAGIAIVGVFLVCAGGVAFDLPGRASDGWDRFQEQRVAGTTETRRSSGRLTSVSGSGRYQMWSGAINALEEAPLSGIGLGSWESWWNPRRGDIGFARNAHSEPMELLAETGLIGGALFVLVLALPLAAGFRSSLRRTSRQGDAVLVVPSLLAFAIALAIDWNWQIGAFMVGGMTLLAIPISQASSTPQTDAALAPNRHGIHHVATGLAVTAIAVSAIVTLALALVAPQSVQASRDALAAGDLSGASAEAARGEASARFAATPALQRALVEERAGNFAAAERAARRAAARTPDDWRPWFLIARIATARNRDAEAITAFRRARSLNPHSALLGVR